MEHFNVNLNIHYSAPDEVWNKLKKLYGEMPHWKGFVDGCPTWYGEDERLIDASVEPSGLSFYAELSEDEWNSWISLFKERATELLGYEIGEPEEGYEFRYWNNPDTKEI